MDIKAKSAEKTHKKMPKALRKAIFWTGAGLIALEGTAAAATELTDGDSFRNNPAQTWGQQAGDDILHPFDWIKNISSVPDTFVNKAGSTKFGESNVTKITTKEAESKDLLEPKITINNDGTVTVTTLLPGIFPAGIPDTELNIENHAEKEQIPYTHAKFIMTEGYELTLPKGIRYALLEADKVPNQQQDLVYTIVGFYYDPVSNVSLILSFETGGFKPGINEKVTSAESFGREFSPATGGNAEKLPESDGTTAIATPVYANQNLHIHINAFKGQITPSGSLQEAQAKSLKSLWENFIDKNQRLILISSK